MAARRLVIVMLVLLFVSTLAAALVPAPEGQDEETATTTRTGVTAEEPTGRTIVRRLDADARRPRTIRISTGDRLVLTVRSSRLAQVEIGGLGQLEDADAGSPARFDLLLDDPGAYPIRLLGSDRELGRIVVGKAGAQLSESGRRAGRSAGTSRSR